MGSRLAAAPGAHYVCMCMHPPNPGRMPSLPMSHKGLTSLNPCNCATASYP